MYAFVVLDLVSVVVLCQEIVA